MSRPLGPLRPDPRLPQPGTALYRLSFVVFSLTLSILLFLKFFTRAPIPL